MARLGTAAGALGILTGLWTLAVVYLDGALRSCPSGGCPPSGFDWYGAAIVLLSILLIFNSAVSFVWHSQVFYVTSLISALLTVALLLDASSIDPAVFWFTVVLPALSAVVNLFAARVRTAVSEQSHPMNLPVFG